MNWIVPAPAPSPPGCRSATAKSRLPLCMRVKPRIGWSRIPKPDEKCARRRPAFSSKGPWRSGPCVEIVVARVGGRLIAVRAQSPCRPRFITHRKCCHPSPVSAVGRVVIIVIDFEGNRRGAGRAGNPPCIGTCDYICRSRPSTGMPACIAVRNRLESIFAPGAIGVGDQDFLDARAVKRCHRSRG